MLRIRRDLLAKLAGVLRSSPTRSSGREVSAQRRAPRDRWHLRRLQDLDRLSKRDREALMRTLDALLVKAQPG